MLLLLRRLPDNSNRALDPAFKTLGKAWWTKVPATVRDDHFFATLDYLHGKETFKKVHSHHSQVVHDVLLFISPSSLALTPRLRFTLILLLRVLADPPMERLRRSVWFLMTGRGSAVVLFDALTV